VQAWKQHAKERNRMAEYANGSLQPVDLLVLLPQGNVRGMGL